MLQEKTKYEEWLTTIANTRFIYNTMDELEEMLDNHSIHNNGMKRCFSTPQKLRAAFRDLKVEVDLMTDGKLSLDVVLMEYQKAWNFYRENMHRRANPEQAALGLLSYFYPPYLRKGISKKKVELYQQIIEQRIEVPFLILMLLKAIPGYDSKGGDVVDMPHKYEHVMTLMEKYTGGGEFVSQLPAIGCAREETNKTRLMLLFHLYKILDVYESYANQENLYDTSCDMKASYINLDIAGYWNECGGKLSSTDFWQIEDALGYGSYFMTHWHKDANNCLTGTRYTLFIFEGEGGDLVYYMLHPEAIKHRMKGQAYGDGDHVWYQTKMLERKPSELPLQRLLFSSIWWPKINLTRCEDEAVIAQYDKWLNHDCQVVKLYQHLEYLFIPDIYAITRTHIYIPSENEGEFYKVPVDAYEGFDRIQLTDNVGLMVMNGKHYLVFDEFLLYIGTGNKELQEYGIERVTTIE